MLIVIASGHVDRPYESARTHLLLLLLLPGGLSGTLCVLLCPLLRPHLRLRLPFFLWLWLLLLSVVPTPYTCATKCPSFLHFTLITLVYTSPKMTGLNQSRERCRTLICLRIRQCCTCAACAVSRGCCGR